MTEHNAAADCPFCAGTDIRFDRHISGSAPTGEVWSMCCYDCGATFPNRYRKELLIEKWNTRTMIPVAVSREMNAALANELHAFCAAAPHDYPGHNIELFERVESFLRTLIPSDSVSDAAALADKLEADIRVFPNSNYVISPEQRQLIVAALRTPIPKAEAEYTVTDDDWTQAIDCAMSCLEEVFITRPQLDNAMQHAFAILSLRKLVGAKAEAEVGVRPQNGDDDAR